MILYHTVPMFYHVGECPKNLRDFNGFNGLISCLGAVAQVTEGTLLELWFVDVIVSSTINEVALDEPSLLEDL